MMDICFVYCYREGGRRGVRGHAAFSVDIEVRSEGSVGRYECTACIEVWRLVEAW